VIIRILRRIAQWGWAYDAIQLMAGMKQVNARIRPHLPPASASDYVLDLGGGTGNFKNWWPGCRYICLDVEDSKLQHFRRTNPDGLALLADGTSLPLPPASIHTIVCKVVAHHLTEAMLDLAFAECRRVLAPGGTLLFLDAVERPDRWISRSLWRMDRGAYPHSAAYFHRVLADHFHIRHREDFTIFHQYVFYVLGPRAVPASSAATSLQAAAMKPADC
jgi:ubiquinone/menaquinone biosynthesis C-methylase UbiE